MNNNPIGIIDSGCGGLTIWQSIVELLPNESTIYIGDHKYSPYGNRTTEFIIKRTNALIRKLIKLKVKLVVIACNTATVSGIDNFRKNNPEIPIIGVVPVIKTAVTITKTGKIAVLSTRLTANSEYQKALINTFATNSEVVNIGCPNLVNIIEKGITDGKPIEHELIEILDPIKNTQIDVLALGCTHYPFLKRTITSILGKKVKLLDSGGAVARQTHTVLKHNNSLSQYSNGSRIFLTSGNANTVTRVATTLLKQPLTFLPL
jgi:glutamate racemase